MGILKQLGEYPLPPKKDPEHLDTQWIKYMHGINRLSVFLFYLHWFNADKICDYSFAEARNWRMPAAFWCMSSCFLNFFQLVVLLFHNSSFSSSGKNQF